MDLLLLPYFGDVMSYHTVQHYRRMSSDRVEIVPVNNNALLERNRSRRPQTPSRARASTPKVPPPPEQQQQAPSSPGDGTPPVHKPASILKFFVSAILTLCKLYIHFPSTKKIPIYLAAVFIISALGDLLRPVRKTFLRPNHVLSEWFVQFPVLWTFSLLLPYVALTSYFYSGGKRREVIRNVFRTSVALFVSLTIKYLFRWIRRVSGFCSNEEFQSEAGCLQQEHRWMAFVTSEETFFLMYHALVIMEESLTFKRWEVLEFTLHKDPWNVLLSPEQTARNVIFVKYTYGKYGGLVRLLLFLLTGLVLLWDVMLVVTSNDFHQNLPQKSCGSVFAGLMWFLTYRVWFPNAWPYLADIGIFRDVQTAKRR
ncbi:putative FIT family protein [Hypsibius exemplaris]|uniref:FIT family protein n=1 Tax=Hypsibius exemplaris TaxID=2072580 RepID=A0A1W0X0S8_HYPEX|nr:putative FIT family protein [Hypsibius exemplaris]